MEENAWRCAARLPGAKDFHGEADSVRARAIARLPHHEPAALTADIAGPVAIHPAVGALESRKVRLSWEVGCEGNH